MADQSEVQRLLDLLDKVDNVTRDLNEMADRSRLQGRYEEAIKYCEESLGLAYELNDSRSEGACLLHRWAVHCLQRDFDEAIDYCHRSKQAFHSIADSHGQALTMFGLGMTYQDWGIRDHDPTKLRQALRTYGNGLEMLQQLRERSEFSGHAEKAKLYQQLIVEVKERFHHVATLCTRRAEEKEPPPTKEPRPRVVSLVSLQFIPIVGQIAAGKPVPTLGDIEGYVATSRVNINDSEYTIQVLGAGRGNMLIFDLESRYFATPVKGDSMDQAGILEDDHVIIRQPRGLPSAPDPGDIIAAVIKDVDREATLKRFAQRGRKNILNPESSNPDHQPYEFSPSEWAKKVEIVGIAVAVLKKVQEN